MINLRYHIVSITAVFLALGIGLTLGSTFLDRVTVDTLKAQLDDVEAQVEETRALNDRLDGRVNDLEGLDDALMTALPERLLADRLLDVPVLVLAAEGTDDQEVDSALSALVSAGADVSGTWRLTDRWLLDDEEEVSDLGRVLDLDTDDPGRLRRNAAIRVAEALAGAAEPAPEDVVDGESQGGDAEVPGDVGAQGPEDPAVGEAAPEAQDTTQPAPTAEPDEPTEPAIAAALEEAGFISYEPLPDAADPAVLLPSAGARFVVLSATSAPEGPQEFAAAIVEELAAEGTAPVVAAQGEVDVPGEDGSVAQSRTSFVGPIRESDGTAERVSTVDSLDTAAGLAALVLAVEDLGQGRVGHYGVAPGASTLLPGPADGP